jgi:hypothetical protein
MAVIRFYVSVAGVASAKAECLTEIASRCTFF